MHILDVSAKAVRYTPAELAEISAILQRGQTDMDERLAKLAETFVAQFAPGESLGSDDQQAS